MIEDPLAYMEAFHREVDRILERIQAAVERNESEVLREELASFRAVFPEWRLHAQDEEVSLFPRLRALLPEGEAAHLRVLEEQHEEAERIYEVLLERLEAQQGEPVAPEQWRPLRQMAENLIEMSRFHLDYENRAVLRMARRKLTTSQMDSIRKEMERRRAAKGQEAAVGSAR